MKKVTEQKMCDKNHGSEHINCCVELNLLGLLLSKTQQGWINLQIKNVFWFSLLFLSETFLTLTRILQDIITNICMSSRKAPAMPVRFKWTLICLTDFKKILKYQIPGKSTQWDLSCSMQMDSQTDLMKLIVNCCNFAKRLIMGPWAWKTPVHIFATHQYQFIVDYAT